MHTHTYGARSHSPATAWNCLLLKVSWSPAAAVRFALRERWLCRAREQCACATQMLSFSTRAFASYSQWLACLRNEFAVLLALRACMHEAKRSERCVQHVCVCALHYSGLKMTRCGCEVYICGREDYAEKREWAREIRLFGCGCVRSWREESSLWDASCLG